MELPVRVLVCRVCHVQLDLDERDCPICGEPLAECGDSLPPIAEEIRTP